jgi:hypothetical protein
VDILTRETLKKAAALLSSVATQRQPPCDAELQFSVLLLHLSKGFLDDKDENAIDELRRRAGVQSPRRRASSY